VIRYYGKRRVEFVSREKRNWERQVAIYLSRAISGEIDKRTLGKEERGEGEIGLKNENQSLKKRISVEF
jgi:hypothetical protein